MVFFGQRFGFDFLLAIKRVFELFYVPFISSFKSGLVLVLVFVEDLLVLRHMGTVMLVYFIVTNLG